MQQDRPKIDDGSKIRNSKAGATENADPKRISKSLLHPNGPWLTLPGTEKHGVSRDACPCRVSGGEFPVDGCAGT